MIEINKTVEKYLTQLLIIGLFQLFAGIVIAFVFLSSTNEIPLIYMPVTIISVLLGYVTIVRVDPGGVVNFYLNKHKRTADEETLYNLVIRFRNKMLINSVSIIFLTVTLLLGVTEHSAEAIISFNLLLVTLILPFAGELCLGTGVKYVSAWWHIRKARS